MGNGNKEGPQGANNGGAVTTDMMMAARRPSAHHQSIDRCFIIIVSGAVSCGISRELPLRHFLVSFVFISSVVAPP